MRLSADSIVDLCFLKALTQDVPWHLNKSSTLETSCTIYMSLASRGQGLAFVRCCEQGAPLLGTVQELCWVRYLIADQAAAVLLPWRKWRQYWVEGVRPGHWQGGWWDGCELLGSAKHRSSQWCCGWDKCREGLGNSNTNFSRGVGGEAWLV